MYWRNLLKALVSLFLGLDRLGNALTGGDYRATVSGRVGFHMRRPHKYWAVLGWVIDSTFYPIDGKKHCYNAYKWERNKGFSHRRGNDIGLGALGIVVIVVCAFLAPLLWLLSCFYERAGVVK